MSNIYIQEPPTNGKIFLKTSVGDIEIELWSKECPKACRNFVQLCMEGLYDGTIFHRVVRGFIVQGGDPSGTGCGGDSIYGQPFKDEFHSRLRFVRRGLVAMANGGKPHDNGSQFFFTLDRAPELQGKHTIFGQVVGDTLYNMLKLADCQVDKNERPENPHKIIKAEIISNPFPDIVPRTSSDDKKISALLKDDKAKTTKPTKNFNLLSFGDEAEEEEELYHNISRSLCSKGKSAFDHRNNADNAVTCNATKTEDFEPQQLNEPGPSNDMLAKVQDKLKANREAKKEAKKFSKLSDEEDEQDMHKIMTDLRKDDEEAKLSDLKQQSRQLRKELLAKNDADEKPIDKTEKRLAIPEVEFLRNERESYKSKQGASRKSVEREKQVYEMLEKFKLKLAKVKECDAVKIAEEPTDRLARPLPEFDDEEDIPESAWLQNTFHAEEQLLKEAVDVHTKDEQRYSIDDPRNPMNKRRREHKHGKRDSDRKKQKN